MPQLRAFTGTFRQRVALESLADLLAWLYTEHKSADAYAYSFGLWLTGVTERQAQPGGRGDLTSFVAHTRKWKWPRFQKQLRDAVEAILATREKPTYRLRRPMARELEAAGDPSGRLVLLWRPRLPPKLEMTDLGIYALDELLSDLHGVAARAIEQCRQCTHFFVRGRAGNGLYCSQRCRYAAAYTRKHGVTRRQTTRARRRPILKVK